MPVTPGGGGEKRSEFAERRRNTAEELHFGSVDFTIFSVGCQGQLSFCRRHFVGQLGLGEDGQPFKLVIRSVRSSCVKKKKRSNTIDEAASVGFKCDPVIKGPKPVFNLIFDI